MPSRQRQNKEPGMVRMFAALLALAAVPSTLYAQDVKATWNVVSLRVDKPLPKQFEQNLSPTGLFLSLVLYLPEKHVVGLDYPACKLDSATDDTGTNLLQDPKKSAIKPQIFWPDYRGGQNVGPYFLTVVKTPNWPAQQAAKIRLKGSVVTLCGTKPKTVEVKDVPLQKGTTTVGPATVGLNPIQSPQETIVQVKCPLPIKSVVFLNANGDTLPHFGSVLELLSTKVEYTGIYHIQSKINAATVRLTYFEEKERVTVQLEVEVGLGL
jgi:hypothetical protein